MPNNELNKTARCCSRYHWMVSLVVAGSLMMLTACNGVGTVMQTDETVNTPYGAINYCERNPNNYKCKGDTLWE